MNGLTYLLTGGFLKGYRTYVLSAVAVIGFVAAYAVGDASLTDTITHIAEAAGLATVRNAVAS